MRPTRDLREIINDSRNSKFEKLNHSNLKTLNIHPSNSSFVSPDDSTYESMPLSSNKSLD